jgi:hypothetical protein
MIGQTPGPTQMPARGDHGGHRRVEDVVDVEVSLSTPREAFNFGAARAEQPDPLVPAGRRLLGGEPRVPHPRSERDLRMRFEDSILCLWRDKPVDLRDLAEQAVRLPAQRANSLRVVVPCRSERRPSRRREDGAHPHADHEPSLNVAAPAAGRRLVEESDGNVDRDPGKLRAVDGLSERACRDKVFDDERPW